MHQRLLDGSEVIYATASKVIIGNPVCCLVPDQPVSGYTKTICTFLENHGMTVAVGCCCWLVIVDFDE